MTWPRRTPDGRLVPEVGALLRARREVARMEAMGLTVDRSRANLLDLGWALAIEDVPIPAEQLLAQLDQLHDRNQVAMQETPPEESVRSRPEGNRNERERGSGDGQVDYQRGEVDRPPVRNAEIDPITEYLAKVPDPPDEEWS
jgi:hypothetical protein